MEILEQVLQRQPDNVKALYRRGVAHVKAWNPDKAEDDLKVRLDLRIRLELFFLRKSSIVSRAHGPR